MNKNHQQPHKKNAIQNTWNVAFIAMGLTGCVTVLILGLALGSGLWLDHILGVGKHYFTLGLVVLSVPFTIAALIWVARFTNDRFNTYSNDAQIQNTLKDTDHGSG